jgi:1-phosphofructokinase
MITTVTPNPSIDVTFDVPALLRGEVHRATARRSEPSGKGVNVSRALTSNRVASTAVLPLGGPEGAELSALLAADAVPFVAVPISGSVRMNVSVTEPDGVATKINERGPELSAGEVAALLQAAATSAAGSAWLLGSGSLPPGAGVDFYAELGRLARRRGALFALDTSGPALVEGLAARPAVVKPNLDELSDVTGTPIQTVRDATSGARRLIAAGAGSVLVSGGAEGALLVTPDTVSHACSAVETPRSTVGAGDALLAGFLAGSTAGRTAGPHALREAVAWASAAVQVPGSRVPRVTAVHREAVTLTLDVDPGRPLRP